jgi:lantibiotic modifying enzyme
MKSLGKQYGRTLGATILFLSLAIVAGAASAQEVPATSRAAGYGEVVVDAAKWIRSTSVVTEKGTAWPAVPGDVKSVDTGLYHGVSGIVLFFLELHRATGDETFLKDARAGADFLLKSIDGEKRCGLYDGLAGMGFVLQETFKATRQEAYSVGAKRCVNLIRDRAKIVGLGVEWNSLTDIVAGSAGTALFLLYAAREQNDSAARDLAVAAGKRLIEVGRPASGGMKWAMSTTLSRLMPNFSHGTAGVAYFLASLYVETKDKAFLDAAVAGAKYLQSVAKTDGEGCLVFHHEPGGEDLYYLGWCHGPAGTARLFYRLYQATGDREWLSWFERCARSVLKSGIPEKRLPGFWNNVSVCCGSAGVAEFCLDVHIVTGDRRYLTLAEQLTEDLLRRATRDEKGTRWMQAEHRVKPDLLIAHTGLMQGAAGVGAWLVRLNRFSHGHRSHLVWPDSPFPADARPVSPQR